MIVQATPADRLTSRQTGLEISPTGEVGQSEMYVSFPVQRTSSKDPQDYDQQGDHTVV